MTGTPPSTSREAHTGRTARRRVRLGAHHAVVAGVVVLGVWLAVYVGLDVPPIGQRGPILELGWVRPVFLAPALVILTGIAELVSVRLRHGDTLEELTLLESAVIVNVLLLPSGTALVVTAVGLTLAYCVRRLALIKSLFNLGSHLAGSAVLLAAVRHIGGSADTFSGDLVAGLLLGALGFYVLNLTTLAAIFWAVNGSRPIEVLRNESRLSVVMAVGTVALGSVAVAMAIHVPLLVPFAMLPAAAVLYAYRAIAQEAQERGRSAKLLAYSQSLAATPDRDSAVSALLDVADGAFPQDETLLLFSDGTVVGSARGPSAGIRHLDLTPGLRALRDVPMTGAMTLGSGLPRGWRSAMLAPLQAEGRTIGTAVLGSRRKGAFATRDRTLLTPIVNAFAVALLNAEHLSAVIAETGKLQAVVDGSSDGIVVLDGSGEVELWNPAVARMSGRSEDEALGMPFGLAVDAREPDGSATDAFSRGRDALSPESPHTTIELPLVRPDGETRIARCAYAAIFDGDEPVRYVVVVHDLTKERQVDRLKADFIATVSHELRTPVTPIKGYADLLRRRGDEMPPEKRARALDVIVDRADHLARLVEDLLLASRMSDETEPARRVDMGTADLAALAGRATEDFKDGESRLSLSVPEEPVTVACDPTRVVQVLTNLVGNALKYSGAAAPVHVRATAVDGVGRVTVTDRGRGLPADQLDRIFEKFHRVEDPAVMTTSGTGLGLYIARHLARAMGGDVAVCSTLGQGSVFTFTLPLGAADAPCTPDDADAHRSGVPGAPPVTQAGGRAADPPPGQPTWGPPSWRPRPPVPAGDPALTPAAADTHGYPAGTPRRPADTSGRPSRQPA
ncbi:MAG: ATP-binding protein [Actinomycetes bacterium]